MGDLGLAARHLEAAVYGNETLGNLPAREITTERLAEVRAALRRPRAPALIRCRRSGAYWVLTRGAFTASVKDSVGVRYLAALLDRPGLEIDVADLVGIPVDGEQPLLDDVAKRSYRRRLDQLVAEIEKAEDEGDERRADHLRGDRRRLLDELRGTAALMGRTRSFPSSSERARTSVQKALRRAIAAVATQEPAIGHELERTIVTGRRCAYRPSIVTPRPS